MNAGIEMLIERLKTHPEDFHYNINGDAYSSAWGDILKEALNCNYITKEEQEAVRNAKLESQREYFTHRVLEILTLSNTPRIDQHVLRSYPSHISTWGNVTTGTLTSVPLTHKLG